ncbi:MAG: extracellular solute-binding protein [Thomasclavelia sp.]|nr:extracellular solute-binding protein [Thomasclavelia sp.]
MKRTKGRLSYILLLCVFIFLYLPMVVMAIFSFNDAKSLSSWNGFSLKWYVSLFNNSQMIDAIVVSISIAIFATIISTILGTITAIGLSRSKRHLRSVILQINNIPIMNPDIVTAVALMILFSFLSFNKGYMTMLLAHIAFCTPFVITNVYPKVQQMDENLADAAMDLGATPFQALTQVILPQIKPGIVAGALLAFTMSFDDFIISYFVSGNGVENISIIVYNMAKRTNPSIYALATIILIVVFAVTFIPYFIVKLAPKTTLETKSKLSKLANKFTHLGLKKISIGAVCIAVVFGFIYTQRSTRRVLKVFNAGEYIDKDTLKLFEDKYNCSISYETFDSNESMYTKYLGGNNYDVLIPSDYMIERLIKEGQLQKLNKKLIPNIQNITPSLLKQNYDKNNDYSIPYFCGNVGILYNKTIVDENDLSEGWNILMNTKYKGNIYMYDSERDSFMVALKALGYSMNTTNKNEIKEAYNWLSKQRSLMAPVYVGDESIDNMTSGLKAMAVMYSGDAATIMEENKDMAYYLPSEGTNYWIDSMVITKSCSQSKLANEFINFMMDDDIAKMNTEEVGYLSANDKASKEVKESVFKDNKAFSIRIDNNDELFKMQSNKTKELFNAYWVKVTAQ